MAIATQHLQGKVGTQMAQFAREALLEIKKFTAVTHVINKTSMKFFESIGLKRSPYMHEDYNPSQYVGFEIVND